MERLHTTNAIILVQSERLRQFALKEQGRFKYTPSDPQLTWMQRLAMLTEELGEVARECLALDGIVQEQPNVGKLKKELTQLAAVAVACIEATYPDGDSLDRPLSRQSLAHGLPCDFCDHIATDYSEWQTHARAHARASRRDS